MELQNKKIVFRSNSKETSALIAAGKKSAQKAIRENKALDLPIVTTKKNQLIRVNNDGSIEVVVDVLNPLRSTLKIKKGTILYAKTI